MGALLIHTILAFNTYPLLSLRSDQFRWALWLTPITLVGVIPADFLMQPDLKLLTIEIVGLIGLILFSIAMFRQGLKRYQSTPALSLQR